MPLLQGARALLLCYKDTESCGACNLAVPHPPHPHPHPMRASSPPTPWRALPT